MLKGFEVEVWVKMLVMWYEWDCFIYVVVNKLYNLDWDMCVGVKGSSFFYILVNVSLGRMRRFKLLGFVLDKIVFVWFRLLLIFFNLGVNCR